MAFNDRRWPDRPAYPARLTRDGRLLRCRDGSRRSRVQGPGRLQPVAPEGLRPADHRSDRPVRVAVFPALRSSATTSGTSATGISMSGRARAGSCCGPGWPDGARVTIMDPNTTVLDFAAAEARPVRPRGGRGRCLQAPADDRAVPVGGDQPRHPLPAGSAVAQGGRGGQRRLRAGAGRGPVRCDRARRGRPAYLAGSARPACVQPAGRVRQPRRQRDGDPGDARGVVPAGPASRSSAPSPCSKRETPIRPAASG